MKARGHLVPKYVVDVNGVRRKVYVNVDKHNLHKRSKVLQLLNTYKSTVSKINKDAKAGNEKAIAAKLILNTGIRIGNEKSASGYKSHHTQKQVSTYGLSTLLKSHVSRNNKGLMLSFTGKRGVKQQIQVKDKQLVEQLTELMKEHPDTDRVFTETPYEITKYIKSAVGKVFTPKDLRMLKANKEAIKKHRSIMKRPLPKNKTELRAEINEIASHVSDVLGNTKGVAKRSYIDKFILDMHEYKRWHKPRKN